MTVCPLYNLCVFWKRETFNVGQVFGVDALERFRESR